MSHPSLVSSRLRAWPASLLALLSLSSAVACGVNGPLPDAGDGGVGLSCGLAPFIPSQALVYGADDGACARVERRDLSEPDMVYKAIPYEATRVAVVLDGMGVDVVDSQALSYTSTHHNWADEATAQIDDVIARITMHFVIDMGFQLEVVLLDATLDDEAREANPLAGPRIIAQQ
jgi:hypothetical protein